MSLNAVEIEKGSSLGRDAWLRLKKNRLAMLSLFVFSGIVVLCLIGLLLSFATATLLDAEQNGEDAGFLVKTFANTVLAPNYQNLEERSMPPGSKHLFGTDHLGRDIFSRVLNGGLISLAVGFVATVVSVLVGISYGTIAGYVGGKLDAFMMRIVDILYSLPFIIIVIILVTFFGHHFDSSLVLVFLAIGLVEWLTMARIVRGQIMSLKKLEFVEAAVSLGLPHRRIMFRHLVPNVLGPVIIYTTLTVPAVMRLEAVLSFLGLGVKPPNSSWGTLIKDGADMVQSDFSLLFFPALFFSLTLFCLNFLGDGPARCVGPEIVKRLAKSSPPP